uniref:C2H2-type domain-containing protein n=1 Tax=Magallana gigas TaxID=29159 RepID=A0A8W8NYV2_MAGGI
MASPGRSSGSPSTICDFARSYRHRPCEGLTESISSLTDDIFQHLKRCQASTRHQTRIPEGLLLLFRSGIFVVSKDVLQLNVCRSHRNSLCTHWYKDSRCCMHPLHPPNHREKPDRGLTCTMAKEIWLHERVVVPVGAGICRRCSERHKTTYTTKVNIESDVGDFLKLAAHLQASDDEILNSLPDTCISEADEVTVDTGNEILDQAQHAQEDNSSLHDISEQSSQLSEFSSTQSSHGTDNWLPPTYDRDKLNRSMEILSEGKFTPMRFTLNTPLEDVQQSTKDYVTRKAKEVIHYALECIAPQQEEELMQLVCRKYFKAESDGNIKNFKISQMNNFVFEEEGIRVFKAYGVGHGHLIPKSTLEKISSNFAFDETRIEVIEDSTTMPATHLQAAQLRLPFGSSDAEDSGDLSCTEPGCIQTFRKPSTLEKHLAVGNHLYHSLNGSADVAMELWAEKCSDSVFYNQSHLIQSSLISSKDNQQVRSLFAQFQIKLTKESTDREKRPKLELTLKSEEDEDLNEVISDLNAMEAFNTVNSVTDICQL